MEFYQALLLAVVAVTSCIFLFMLSKVPKPLENLVCVITGGAGEIGQVVSCISFICVLHVNVNSMFSSHKYVCL